MVVHCQFQLTRMWKIIWTLNYLPPFLITITSQLTETAMWRMWRIIWKPNYLIPFHYPPTCILKNKINMCFFMSIIFNHWKPYGNIRREKKRMLIVNGIAQSPSLNFSIIFNCWNPWFTCVSEPVLWFLRITVMNPNKPPNDRWRFCAISETHPTLNSTKVVLMKWTLDP